LILAGYNAQNYTVVMAAEVIHSDFCASPLPCMSGDDEYTDVPSAGESPSTNRITREVNRKSAGESESVQTVHTHSTFLPMIISSVWRSRTFAQRQR
jgi:hypothetical protein